jgi:hypothetical protein
VTEHIEWPGTARDDFAAANLGTYRERERPLVGKTFHNLERNLARQRKSQTHRRNGIFTVICATRYSGLFGSA